MSNASRGSAFERKVKAHLEEAGWYVTRAAGSHGCADLIAISPDEVAFVQAKLGGPGAMPPAEWNELFQTAIRYGGVPVLVGPGKKRGRLAYLRMLDEKPVTGLSRGPSVPVEPWDPSPVPVPGGVA